MVYLSLNKELLREKKEFDEVSHEFSDEEPARISKINEETGEISVVCETSRVGYVSMDLKLDGDDLVKVIALAIKKLNKAKALFESLK